MERSSLTKRRGNLKWKRSEQSGRRLPSPSRKSGPPRPGPCRPVLHRPSAAYAERIDKRQKTKQNDDLPKISKFGTGYA